MGLNSAYSPLIRSPFIANAEMLVNRVFHIPIKALAFTYKWIWSTFLNCAGEMHNIINQLIQTELLMQHFIIAVWPHREAGGMEMLALGWSHLNLIKPYATLMTCVTFHSQCMRPFTPGQDQFMQSQHAALINIFMDENLSTKYYWCSPSTNCEYPIYILKSLLHSLNYLIAFPSCLRTDIKATFKFDYF